jgi:GT2 family glycosyltransferase
VAYSTSAVVLNYNGGQMVLDCLASLVEQEGLAEIVCVDNGSNDGSDLAIEARFPQVRLVKLAQNSGFAGGMNKGIDETTGDLVALINLDVVLDPSYLRRCADALAGPDLGGATGKLFRPGDSQPRILDTTGHIVYRNRRAVDRGERERDFGQYDQDRSLFSVCGAAPVYRRAMLEDTSIDGEYFDQEFFAYFEDFDLSWRAQLRGWGFVYVPEATGTHHRGGTGSKASTFILACNHRNRLLVMLHNDSPASFFRHFAGIAYTELRATLHMLSLRPAALPLAWAQFFRLLPSQLAKRRKIQRARKISWRQLEPSFHKYEYGVRAFVRRARQRAEVL